MTQNDGLGWQISEERCLDGYTVEWEEPGELILSRRNMLFRTMGAGAPIERLATFPMPASRALPARLRLIQRLLRFEFYNVLKLPDSSYFLSFGRTVAVLRDGRVRPVHGVDPRARLLRGACAVSAAGDVYFGEYAGNPSRDPVRIYRLPAGSETVKVAHTFRAGEVRHVHGIYADPHGGALWCVTGDRPTECRILFSHDGFRTIEVAGAGDETWRTVSLQFTADAVYFGMDAEFRTNHLYRLDRASLERRKLTAVEGPVYYSAKRGADLFFAVTAELCPSQTEPVASIWHVAADDTCRRIVVLQKDALPVRYFLPGTIQFPAGPGTPGTLLFRGLALRGADQRVLRIRRTAVARHVS
jgi:hypothetical protein